MTTLDSTPPIANFTIYKGDTFVNTFRIKNRATRQLQDLTGATARMQLRASQASDTILHTFDISILENFDSGTIETASSTQIIDTSKSWVTNEWVGYVLRITNGVGNGQIIPIVSNTSTTLTLGYGFKTLPNSSSLYTIEGGIVVSLSDWDSITWTTGVYDLEVTYSGGVVETLCRGTITVEGDVSR